jgi:hypothetical protein
MKSKNILFFLNIICVIKTKYFDTLMKKYYVFGSHRLVPFTNKNLLNLLVEIMETVYQ